MSDSRTDQTLFLMDPELRGVIPLDGLHTSRSLKKFVRQSDWTVRYNTDFVRVINECAQIDSSKNRKETWISLPLEMLYNVLNENGYAFSVEVYESETLVGGLYGVSLGGAFFGESMFSRKTNASKVALIGLVQGLIAQGYSLLDTQYLTPHLETLGGIEIPRHNYHKRLEKALEREASFPKGERAVRELLS